MHIGIVGPIATADIAHLLEGDAKLLPAGYAGAPLLASLITELLSRGHTVSAFTLSSDLALKRGLVVSTRGPNFNMHYSPMRPRAWRPNGWLPGRIVDLYRFERRALQEAISKTAPDVVHAHWAYEFALAALATSIPNVVTCHDSPLTIAKLYSRSRPTISAYRWLRVLLARKVLREATCVTAVSPYMRDQVQGMTTTRITVVPNPVDNLALTLAQTRSAPAAPRIAMVCNGWDNRKNPIPGLMAFVELKKHRPDAEMHLFGFDFGPGQKADDWCRSRGVQNGMFFRGPIAHTDLLKELADLDLLLHPSLEESFGMVIAEAMAMGLPVVAGESSGAVPWVTECKQSLCDVKNANSVYQAVLGTLAPARYVEQSLHGMASTKARFSSKIVSDQYISLYEQAIKNSCNTM